jgi:hypothetical protein
VGPPPPAGPSTITPSLRVGHRATMPPLPWLPPRLTLAVERRWTAGDPSGSHRPTDVPARRPPDDANLSDRGPTPRSTRRTNGDLDHAAAGASRSKEAGR